MTSEASSGALGFRADNSSLQAPRQPVEWISGSFEANGIVIKYHETKPSSSLSPLPKLVFLHGLCGAGPVLIPLLSNIADHFHICLPDARGHGETNPIPDGSFTMDNLIADAAAVIKQFSPDEPIFLAGHSMGASTAARVAKFYSELTRGVVLEDPPWLREEGTPVAAVERSAPWSPQDAKNSNGTSGEAKGPEAFQGGGRGRGRDSGRGGGRGSSGNGPFDGIFNASHNFKRMSEEEFAKVEDSEYLPKHAYTMARSLRYLAADCIQKTFRETDDVINEAVAGITVPVYLWTGNPAGVCKADVAESTVATWPKGKLHNWPDAGHVIHAAPRGEAYLKKMCEFFKEILDH